MHIGTILEALGNLGTGTILSFIYGWELTLVIIGFLPFLIGAGILNMKSVDKFLKKDFRTFEEASQVRLRNLMIKDDFGLLCCFNFEAIFGSP